MDLDQLTGNELIQFLPHRGRNLLLDTVDRSETEKGAQAEINLKIEQPDPKGRDIFLEKAPNGDPIYSPFMFAEFLALGSIVLLTDMPPDSMAYFSSITNFKRTGSVSASSPLKGNTIRNKDRGPFRRFTGRILDSSNQEVAQTDIMAFAFSPDMKEEERDEKKVTEKPQVNDEQSINKEDFSWKPKEMVFADAIANVSSDGTSGTTIYTYPDDHPFVEGHFPGNPIMMGITQWIGCADAMTCLASQLIQSNHSTVSGQSTFEATANIEVIKQDGAVACDVKALTLKFTQQEGNAIPRADLIATKRVGFRDMVRPHDTLYFQVTNFKIVS